METVAHWMIYKGDAAQSHDGIERLPSAPPWRDFEQRDDRRGRTFRPQPAQVELVNAALYLRRPILVTGPPGSGKTSLAYSVAKELKLGAVLRWSVNSKTTLKDGLYHYDALARLRDIQRDEVRAEVGRKVEDLGRYTTLQPLGTALLPSSRPRVLLIDEIDKADIDFPNDLLHVFEDGEFEIPELARIAEQSLAVSVRTVDSTSGNEWVEVSGGRIRCKEFPFVVITSNGERELPPAFLRRCLRLDIAPPSREQLVRIVEAHLGAMEQERFVSILDDFQRRRDEEGHMLATDQLLNAVYLLTRDPGPEDRDRNAVLSILLRELER